jgi:hypothetical protein
MERREGSMNGRQQIKLVGAVSLAFLGIVVLFVHPELMLFAPLGYGASWLRRIRVRRMWTERVEQRARLGRLPAMDDDDHRSG